LNCVVLIGRLTKDPELRYIPGTGKPVATFTIAVNRPFKNREGQYEADFIPIQVWGKSAENCANYLQKGRQAAVSGRLQIRSYDDQQGQRRWVTEVVADRVEFLEWAGRDEKPSGGQEKSFELKGLDPEGFQALDDDDIPF
jgi:single-strand DNA-binding protein